MAGARRMSWLRSRDGWQVMARFNGKVLLGRTLGESVRPDSDSANSGSDWMRALLGADIKEQPALWRGPAAEALGP